MKKKIAFFDFDHTISSHDSFVKFLFFSVNFFHLFFGMLCLSPVVLLYLLRLLSNEKAKSRVIAFFYRNWTEERFAGVCRAFSEQVLPEIILPAALERIRWHKQQGHAVYVVSASIDLWLRDWCHKQGVGLISTRLELEEGRFTGRFLTPNCYGPEKVRRIREELDLSEYAYIYAYGDSRGDREMLALADEAFFRHFTA